MSDFISAYHNHKTTESTEMEDKPTLHARESVHRNEHGRLSVAGFAKSSEDKCLWDMFRHPELQDCMHRAAKRIYGTDITIDITHLPTSDDTIDPGLSPVAKDPDAPDLPDIKTPPEYPIEPTLICPSFDDPRVPEEANYIAQDSDGVWTWFVEKPHFSKMFDMWGCYGPEHLMFGEIEQLEPNPDWKNTLISRKP